MIGRLSARRAVFYRRLRGESRYRRVGSAALAHVDCGAGTDTIRINHNELHKIKHCENVLVTTRLKRFQGTLPKKK